MVIGFKKQFVEKILTGSKIHTIREDLNSRWESGRIMNMSTDVRTKEQNQFNTAICTGVRKISINPSRREILLLVTDTDGFTLNDFQIKEFAKNDGFDSEREFWEWFNKPFEGKLIYWTDRKYYEFPIKNIF